MPIRISELHLSTRASNCLQNAHIEIVGDLVNMTPKDLLKTRHCGRRTIEDIRQSLEVVGLHLKGEGWRGEELSANESIDSQSIEGRNGACTSAEREYVPGQTLMAIAEFRADYLAQLLQLPPTARIVAVAGDFPRRDVILVKIYGAGWPVAEGALIPPVVPWANLDETMPTPILHWDFPGGAPDTWPPKR